MQPLDLQFAIKFVAVLYRVLFKRDPDKEGWRKWSHILATDGFDAIAYILTEFVGSDEFKSRHFSFDESSLEQVRSFDFTLVSDHVLSRLFDKTATYWRSKASDPNEIYWSVLSNEEYKGEISLDKIKDFLASGAYDVERIYRICEQVGFSFSASTEYLEYGCGVGRLVVNLPSSIEKIHCVDFSAVHLDEAKVNVTRCGLASSKYLFHAVSSLQDLGALPGNQSIIHSFIVLQHNTPPVIEYTVKSLLYLLSPKGIAILHIPLAKVDYEFNTDGYLLDPEAGQSMEMHILPKENLYRLARFCDCSIVYSFCDGGCAGDIYSEIVVFQKNDKSSN